MTYLRRSNVQQKKGRAMTAAAIMGVGLLFVIHLIFPNFYARMFLPMASVAWKSEASVLGIFGRLGSLVSSKYTLLVENQRLQGEIAIRDSGALLLDGLKRENEQLKSLLGRVPSGKDVLGIILSRPPLSFYDTFIIDVGSSDGIAIGDKVYSDGTVLLGDVSEVFGATARVSLFSMPGRIVPVLFGSSTVQAQAVGRGGGNFEARLPVGVDVKEGDAITFPHIRSHIFGIVENISVDSTDSLQTILFKAPVNMHQLQFVEVETESKAR
ncbi:MAG: rod shape-determining protein MreC [Candidatus Paceibacterota bacterium]|jgi:cell shape-determining protein MreC